MTNPTTTLNNLAELALPAADKILRNARTEMNKGQATHAKVDRFDAAHEARINASKVWRQLCHDIRRA